MNMRYPGLLLFGLLSMFLVFAGCPANEETTIIYQTSGTSPSAFPGTPASACNLAEDAKALSPGGQDVTTVRVFWDGHDSNRAVVLIETRVFLMKSSSSQSSGGETTTSTSSTYFRHIWASYFDGSTLTPPVEIVGENMSMVGSKTTFVTVDQTTLEETDSGVSQEWIAVPDTAMVLFARPDTAGAFGANPSSADFIARMNDAVILFKATDVDTATGLNPAGGQADNTNTRLYYAYFDYSQRSAEFARTEDVVGTGFSSEREFRYGFTTQADAVNSEVTFNTTGSSLNNLSSFGVLADGFLGQACWDKEENEVDDGATFSNFLVAVWTEMAAGYATARGVFHRFTSSATPSNEYDMKMMAAVFDIETATFGSPQEIEPDTDATENDSSVPSWIQSDGDSWCHEGFITYDNQIFFTYVDCAVDNDPASVAANTNWDQHEGAEGLDTVMNWNRFTLTSNTTSGSGSFLSNSLRISPATRAGLYGVTLEGTSGYDIPDLIWEGINEFDNENGKVVFGADEGLEVTYVFFTHSKLAVGGTFPIAYPFLDDTDLYAAQIRHNLASGMFTAADDLLEVDTGNDQFTMVANNGDAMDFDSGPSDNFLEIGASGGGPPSQFWAGALLTIGSETRLVLRQNNSGTGSIAYATGAAGTDYEQDFAGTHDDATATVEHIFRPVQDDWSITLNKSSEWFLVLYRQQDATNQSFGDWGAIATPASGDVGLYASRINTIQEGQTVQTLSAVSLVGSDSVRLDTDSPSDDPTAVNEYRDDVVMFEVQKELDHPIAIQSDLETINVLFLKIDDDNPADDDARNTTSGDQSQEILYVVQVQNGASALTLSPGTGGTQVAVYPFHYYTEGNSGTTLQEDKKMEEMAVALDAGVDGSAIVYYKKPTTAEVQDSTGTYILPTPNNERFFAANFDGGASLTTKQISTNGGNAKNQVLFFVPPTTRGLSASSALGKHHMILWIEDPGWAVGGFVGGGALMSARYNKAVSENGDTSANLVTAADAFTPALSGGPQRIDIPAGDGISFPIGFGADHTDFGMLFVQFGEIYYNEYAGSTASWWTDSYGLPNPTLVSNEGFPGMPSTFVTMVFNEDYDLFMAQAFANYQIEEFQGTVDGQTLTCTRYDNLKKALVIYAKDDGGWDPEDDGTGFTRLFCRIRN